MGIHGLQTYIADHLGQATMAPLKAPRKGSNVIVCDALGFIRIFYDKIDFIRCGQWDAVYARIKKFLAAISDSGFTVHMVFDGVDEDVKEGSHKKKYRERLSSMRFHSDIKGFLIF